MYARLAFGILLALGLADLAVLNLKLAPELAALPTEDSSSPVKSPVAGEGVLAKPSSPAKPQETAPSPTTAAPPPKLTAVAQVPASAVPSSAPSPSGTPAPAIASAEPTPTATTPPSTAAVEPPAAEQPKDRRPPSSTPGEAIPDIVFDLDVYVISSASAIADLKAVAQKLNRDPSKRLVIRGHSDQMGSFEYKRALSLRRAMTVQSFLVSHGAPADRISVEAVSDSEPADTRNTPVAWAQNRRVQVIWR